MLIRQIYGIKLQLPPYMGVYIPGVAMRCPYCQNERSRVVDTTHDARGGVRRRRECLL